MGGGFGRRARSDYIADSVEISKALGVPIQVTWTREDDTQQDATAPRPTRASTGGLDANGCAGRVP